MVIAVSTLFGYVQKIRSKKVAKNFTSLTIGSIVSQAINLVAVIKLTKILSPDNYGLFSFLIVQAQLIVAIGDLGLTNIIIRTIARNKEKTKDLIINGVRIRVLAVILFSIIYYAYNYFAGSLTNYQVLLVCFFPVITCATNLLESTFLGHQKMFPPSVINILFSLCWCVIVFALPENQVTVINIFILFLSLSFVKGVAFYLVLKSQDLILGTSQPFRSSSKKLLMESWPYFSLILLCLPFNYLSNNFLDINSTTQEIGYYNLAQKIMSPIPLVIGFALSALFPNLSRLWVDDQQRFNSLIVRGTKIFILVCLLPCFVFTLFAKEIISLIFSDSYDAVIKVCQLQIWFVFLMGVNSLIGTIWAAVNKERLLVKSTIINVLISTPLLYLGSMYGAVGLSYAYIISFSLFEVYLWIVFTKTVGVKISGDKVMWLFAALLFIISYSLPYDSNIFIKLFISVISMGPLYYYTTSKLRGNKQ